MSRTSIGPPEGGQPVKGYLDIPALIAIAKEHSSRCDPSGLRIPGRKRRAGPRCAAAGIKFVGPTADLLEAFGDKTAAKRLAKQTNVPTLPGTEHGLTDPAEVKAAAKKIGYPIIIKASFGGGGRGMRVVRAPTI